MFTSPRATTQRILQGSLTPVARGVVRDQDGERVAATGTLTATVRSLDGTASGTTGRATTDDSADNGTGAYTVALTTPEAADLMIWQVDWLDDATLRHSTWHRIVGGFMLSRADLQAESGIGTQFTDTSLDLAREWIQNKIEHNTGAAWNPRYDVFSRFYPSTTSSGSRIGRSGGRYRDRLVLPFFPIRSLESFTIDGDAVASTDYDLDQETGTIYGPSFYGQVDIGFTHGYDNPTETLRRAAVVAAADVLKRAGSGLSERTRSSTNEQGTIQVFSFPGLDHPTGIDFVDAAIMEHAQRQASIA